LALWLTSFLPGSRQKSLKLGLKIAVEGASSTDAASRGSSQVADFTRRKGGAGDRGRTGDVQLGKGAEPGNDEEDE